MKITPQFNAHAKPMIHYAPHVIEKSILTYAKRCLPIKKSKSLEFSQFKKEADEISFIKHIPPLNGPGRIVSKTL